MLTKSDSSIIGRTKGHAVVRPAVVRAADDGGDDGVVTAGDLAEQTENADDAMAVEDGLGGGLGAASGGVRRGAGGGAGDGGGVADGAAHGGDGGVGGGGAGGGGGRGGRGRNHHRPHEKMSGEGAPASDGGLPSGHHDERNFLRREVMMALNRNAYPFRTERRDGGGVAVARAGRCLDIAGARDTGGVLGHDA